MTLRATLITGTDDVPAPSSGKAEIGGRFGYFLFFSARGGEGESEAPGGGIGFLLKIPGGGGCFQEGEGPGGCLW